MNLRAILTSLVFLGALGAGCVVDVSRSPYEACQYSDSCSGGTSCTQAMYSITGSPGNLCTVGCTRGEQCPISPYGSGYLPTCIVSASVGSGLCYDTCIVDGDCGGSTACATVPGTTVRVCVPRT